MRRTFGGLGDSVDGVACHAALRVASTKTEASLPQGLLSRPLCISVRVCRRGWRMALASLFCGAAHEDEARIL